MPRDNFDIAHRGKNVHANAVDGDDVDVDGDDADVDDDDHDDVRCKYMYIYMPYTTLTYPKGHFCPGELCQNCPGHAPVSYCPGAILAPGQ